MLDLTAEFDAMREAKMYGMPSPRRIKSKALRAEDALVS
jgi:hypothetical protein